jgi:hypothetical protein
VTASLRIAAVLVAVLLVVWLLRGWWVAQGMTPGLRGNAPAIAVERARYENWVRIVTARDLSGEEDIRLLMVLDPTMDMSNTYCLLYRHREWKVVKLVCPGGDLSMTWDDPALFPPITGH